jgi:hypothetical protein
MIITGTGSSAGTWTEKRTSDHYLQGQNPRKEHGKRKGLVLIITGTGFSIGTWKEKSTSVDHYRDRILKRDMDTKKDYSSIDHYKNQDKKLRSRQGLSHVERSGEQSTETT